jgi:hypothetical protein
MSDVWVPGPRKATRVSAPSPIVPDLISRFSVVVQFEFPQGSAVSRPVGNLGMTKKQLFLKPVLYPDGNWIGAYECSVCERRFQSDETDLGKLSREFAVHERTLHRRLEDFSQTAART